MLAQICDGIHYLSSDSGILEVVDLSFVKEQADMSLYTWQSTLPGCGTAAVLSLISGIVCIFERVQLSKHDRETKSKWEERPSHCNPSEVAFPSDGCNAHDDSVNHHPTFRLHKPREVEILTVENLNNKDLCLSDLLSPLNLPTTCTSSASA